MKQTKKEFCMENCISLDTYSKNIDINQLNLAVGNNNDINLTELEADIILASSYNPKNIFDTDTVYLFEDINKLDYLFWKSNQLSRLSPKFKQINTYNKFKGRTITSNILYFSNNNEIKRIINTNNPITLLCLAFIIMDNSTFECNSLILTIPENQIKHLLDTIYNNYNIKCTTINENNIIFDNFELANLKTAIYPYMFNGLKYKLGEEYYNLPICTVSKTVVFDSAHFLDEYDGKCGNLHGGRYELTVHVKGPINPDTGMVVDFTYLQKVLKEKIIDKFDHHCLNYVVPQLAWRSTTEVICIYIWNKLIKPFPLLYKIELKETPNSKCEYMGQGFESYNSKLDLLNIYPKTFKFRNILTKGEL